MNKIIILLLFSTSLLTFAQRSPQHFPSPFSIENSSKTLSQKRSNLFAQKKTNGAEQVTIQKNSMFQIDSSYIFNWDSIGQNWKINAKTVTHFNSQNNLNEKIALIKNEKDEWENFLKTSYSFSTNDTIEVNMYWIDGDWQNVSQKTLTYDSYNNNISSTNKQWDANLKDWVLSGTQIYRSFDSNKNELTMTIETWMGGILFSSSKTTNTFESNNKPKSSLTEEWTFITKLWQKKDSISYSYDLINNVSLETNFMRNGSAWINETETEYTFNEKNMLERVFNKKWDGSNWINETETEYFFDAMYNIERVFNKKWNGSGWINDTQYIQITWGNSLEMPISYTLQSWINDGWVDQNRVSSTFDTFNNETGMLRENWTGSSWVINIKSIYTYNANHQKTGGSSKIWNPEGTKILYGDSTYNFIQTVLSQLKKVASNNNQLSVYQSHNKGEYILNSTQSNIRSIELFSSIGQVVYEKFKIDQPTFYLNLSNLNKGIYILKLDHGSIISTRKILKD